MTPRSQAHRVRRSRPAVPRIVVAAVGLLALAIVVGAPGGVGPRSSDRGTASGRSPSTGPAADGALSATGTAAEPVTGGGSSTAATPDPGTATIPGTVARTPVIGGPLSGAMLIADRGNGRLLVVSNAGRILWRFPGPGSLPVGQAFSADDAFLAPDGKTIVANDETHQVIDRIDIATRRVVWQYGHYDVKDSGSGYLHTPDDAYPLANGDVMVADIENCRIMEIAPSKRVVRTWGRSGACVDRAPFTYGRPNGDTPLPDGGLLVTEIKGSRVVRLSASGRVIFDIHVPTRYPSDAQLDAHGNVIVADYSSPGQVVAVSPTGRLLWRFGPTHGRGRLDHPSLATPLPNGLISVNDDFRHRLIVFDPRTMRILWQYGRTDIPGRTTGELDVPDGHQPVPVNAF